MLPPTQLLLFTALASAPASPPPAEPSPGPAAHDTQSAERFDLALFRTSGLDATDLRAELRLRMPEVQLLPHAEAGDLAGHDRAYLYLETKATTPSLHQIAVIVSDGRAYYGEVAVDEGLRAERVVASTLANLIFSIEQGSVAPDRQDATIPPRQDAEPAPAEGAVTGVDAEQADHSPDVATTRSPRLEVAVTPGLGHALGLGPPAFGDVYLGFGGGVAVELRTRRGLHGFAGVRALGRTVDAFRLTRTRVALGLGFAWRRERFEFVIDAGFAIEPWVVSSSAGIEPIRRTDDVAARPPLVSGFLRLSPGYHLPLDKGAIRGLRIGPRVDIAGGFVPYGRDPPVGVAQLSHEDRALFRLGGAELTTGIELAIWLAR